MMDMEEKYTKLRAAAVKMVGVIDDPGVLLALLIEMRKQGAEDDDDNGQAALEFVVTLIETGKP